MRRGFFVLLRPTHRRGATCVVSVMMVLKGLARRVIAQDRRDTLHRVAERRCTGSLVPPPSPPMFCVHVEAVVVGQQLRRRRPRQDLGCAPQLRSAALHGNTVGLGEYRSWPWWWSPRAWVATCCRSGRVASGEGGVNKLCFHCFSRTQQRLYMQAARAGSMNLVHEPPWRFRQP